MRNLVLETTLRNNNKIKGLALTNKQKMALNKAKKQTTKEMLEEKFVTKEPRTLMLDMY